MYRFVKDDEVVKNTGSAAPQCGKEKGVYSCSLPCIAGLYDTERNFS